MVDHVNFISVAFSQVCVDAKIHFDDINIPQKTCICIFEGFKDKNRSKNMNFEGGTKIKPMETNVNIKLTHNIV